MWTSALTRSMISPSQMPISHENWIKLLSGSGAHSWAFFRSASVNTNDRSRSPFSREISGTAWISFQRFTVLGVAKIFHKSVVRPGSDPLQVEIFDEIDLCVPALRFESALADVVVAGRARKGEVIGEHVIECGEILVFPHRVPLTDELLAHQVLGSRFTGSRQFRQAYRTN